MVDKPQVFASNELVIAVPEGSEIKEVLRPRQARCETRHRRSKRPGLVPSAVPNAYRRPNAKRSWLTSFPKSPRSSIVAKLEQGVADAGFVYVTDEKAAEGLEPVTIPDKLQPQVEYSVAVIKSSGDKAAAEQFVEGLISGDGQEDLREADLVIAVRRSGFAAIPLPSRRS